jgi:hypothetical protein
MEPNPYEPSKTDQPMAVSQVAKGGLGLAAVLLLTPPAMVIAVLACCSAGRSFPAHRMLVVFGIPLGILIGLTTLAGIVWRPRCNDPRSVFRVVLVSTPLCVASAAVVGFILAGLTYLLAEQPGGWMPWWAEPLMMAACWTPPAIALLWMLWLTWRNR